MIGDKEIRLKFIQDNKDFFKGDNKEFVNEYGINKTNIVDLASFDFSNNIFYGFEIKSEKDNTKRLLKQLTSYVTFFQIVYVVTHEKHLDKVFEIVSKKHLDKVGIIKVDSNLNFEEIKRASKYKPFYPTFISNLDLEEIRILCESKGIPLEGSKKILLGKVKRYTSIEDIYKGLHNKLRRYHVKSCEICKSNLYYNKLVSGDKHSYCYECGNIIIDY